MFQYPTKTSDNPLPISQIAFFFVVSCPEWSGSVANCNQLHAIGPLRSAIGRLCPKFAPSSSSSPPPRFRLHAGILNAICIHQPRQCQRFISTAMLWRNLPLNHRPPRPPSSVLFCVKLKPRWARGRRTSKCGKGSLTLASISPAKLSADSFAGRAENLAYPRRGAEKVSKAPN